MFQHIRSLPMARHSPARIAAVILLPLLFLYPSLALPDSAWGTRPYDEERAEYDALVQSFEQAFRKQSIRSQQVEGELQALLAGYEPDFRTHVIQQYESSQDFYNRHERFRAANERAQRAMALYDDARAVFTEEDAQIAGIRANLWKKHIDWLQQRSEAKEIQIWYLDSRLVHVRAIAKSGVFGIDFEEVIADTQDDLYAVSVATLQNTVAELQGCADGLAANMLAAGVGYSAPLTLAGEVKGCIEGMVLNSILKAYEEASKKQFLDRMQQKNVHADVADYWWREIIMPDAPSGGVSGEILKKIKMDPIEQLKDEFAADVLPKYMREEVTNIQVKVADEMLNSGQWDNAPALKKAGLNQMKQRVRQRTAEAAEKRFADAVKSAKFAGDFASKVALVYMNSADFEAMERNQLARYAQVRECLKPQGAENDAKSIIGVFQMEMARYRDFIRQCRDRQADEDGPMLAEGPDLEPALARLQQLAAEAAAGSTNAGQACADFDSAFSAMRETMTAVDRALADAARASEAPPATVDGPALAREALRAAQNARDLSTRLGPLRDRARLLRDQACGGLQLVASDQAALDKSLESVAELDRLRLQALSIDEQIISAVAAARSANERAGAQHATLAPETGSLAAEIDAIRSQRDAASTALATIQSSRSDLLNVAMQAARVMAESRNTVEEFRASNPEHPATEDMMRTLEQEHGKIIAARQRVNDCAPNAETRLQQVEPLIAAYEQRIAERDAEQALAAQADSVDEGPWRDKLAAAIRDAEATEATAELFVEGIAQWAELGAGCGDAAQAIADAQSAQQPDAGTADASGGWVAGDAVTESSTSSPAPAAPAVDVTPTIQAAVDAANHCRYDSAMIHVAQIERTAPDHPWLADNGSRIAELEQRQRATARELASARQALAASDWRRADEHIDAASREAVSCQSQQVSQLANDIADARTRDRIARQEANRAAAQQLLGPLGSILKAVNNSKDDVRGGGTTSRDITESIGSRGDGDNTSGSDACAHNIGYNSAALDPTPQCKCDGYRFDARQGRCVADPTARTTASGSNASATSSTSRTQSQPKRNCRPVCLDYRETATAGFCYEWGEECD